MFIKKYLNLIPIALCIGISLFFIIEKPFHITPQIPNTSEETLQGTVIKIENSTTIQTGSAEFNAKNVIVEITKGSDQGQRISVKSDDSAPSNLSMFKENDRVMVIKYTNKEGLHTYYIADFIRTKSLITLFILFVIISIAISGLQGAGAMIGMFYTFIIIFSFILPLFLSGQNPLHIAILGGALIFPITFTISHGLNRKTVTAIIGTLLALIVTGFIAQIFTDFGHLTGMASEESVFLSLESKEKINFRGLVLAGMIIGILGLLDDITISQASIIQQIKNLKNKIGPLECFTRAMKVGRDHISSMINTLVLVYAGASIPLLLLFLDYNQSFFEVINYEFMAQEIIQTLVGSIGLILAVPITTIVGTILIKPTEKTNSHEEIHSCGHVH